MITISIECPFCGKTHYVIVKEADYRRWQDGEFAQKAFPYLSATEREQLISQMCPNCQKSFFEDEEDE